jgi:hypothetical protein
VGKRKLIFVGNSEWLIQPSKRSGKLSVLSNKRSRIKRLRKPEPSNVDALLKWFSQQRREDVQVSGPILMVKAQEHAKLLSDEEFVGSAGGMVRFKLHHVSCG